MKLMRLTALIYLIMLVMLVVLLSFSRQRLAPAQITALHFDKCELPCWIGIIPGRTSIGEAKRLIRQLYKQPSYELTFGDAWVEMQNEAHEFSFRAVMRTQDGKLTDGAIVRIIELQGSFSIAEIMSVLGVPQSIVLWGRGGGTFPSLIYQRHKTVLVIDDPDSDPLTCTPVSLTQTIQVLTIYYQIPSQNYWVQNKPQGWRGFSNCYK